MSEKRFRDPTHIPTLQCFLRSPPITLHIQKLRRKVVVAVSILGSCFVHVADMACPIVLRSNTGIDSALIQPAGLRDYIYRCTKEGKLAAG